MKQKKFKIKSNTLVKFKSATSFTAQWLTETEPTTTMTSTTSITTTGIFNK